MRSSPLVKTTERKEIIQLFKEMKWINENIIVSLLNDAIDERNTMVDAIFQIYDTTRDKADFAENLELFGKSYFQKRIIEDLDSIFLEFNIQWENEKLDKFNELLESQKTILISAYQLFLITRDGEDFLDTIDKIFEQETI